MFIIIHLAYLGESKKLQLSNETLKLLIVRKPPTKLPEGFIHAPQLSPSAELFIKTQKWKKGEFNNVERKIIAQIKENENVSNEDIWWHLYRVEFLKELDTRHDMKKAINRLIEIEKYTEIYLFCYCFILYRCHRYLVGKDLEAKGIKVDFRENEKNNNDQQLLLF